VLHNGLRISQQKGTKNQINEISLPNNTSINCVNWNNDEGWLACGGQNSLLRVLKLESSTPELQKEQKTSVSSQTLQGHSGNVILVEWNPKYQKLSTADSNGLIIVWNKHKGAWYEEMVNKKEKAMVSDMNWDKSGQKICIGYEDGTINCLIQGSVIVGSVDGSRLWGKQLNLQGTLQKIMWSPSGKYMMIVNSNGMIFIFDSEGNFCVHST
jgi:WD repeat-containing protein 35